MVGITCAFFDNEFQKQIKGFGMAPEGAIMKQACNEKM